MNILYNFSSGSNFSKAHFIVVMNYDSLSLLEAFTSFFAFWVILPQPPI